MELRETFVVPAALSEVWELFDDVPEVVACMPGAQVTERISHNTYTATFTVAVGPIRPKFDVRATIERDERIKEGRIRVNAIDKRGGSGARGEIVYTLVAEGDGTAVDLVETVALSGPLAQFGRAGMIEEVNAQMTREFAQRLASRVAPPASSTLNGSASAASTLRVSGATAAQAPSAPPGGGDVKILRLLARALLARITRPLRLARRRA